MTDPSCTIIQSWPQKQIFILFFFYLISGVWYPGAQCDWNPTSSKGSMKRGLVLFHLRIQQTKHSGKSNTTSLDRSRFPDSWWPGMTRQDNKRAKQPLDIIVLMVLTGNWLLVANFAWRLDHASMENIESNRIISTLKQKGYFAECNKITTYLLTFIVTMIYQKQPTTTDKCSGFVGTMLS
jgi:hypothetical protein